MKKKILIASILLSVTAILLISFIGCQERSESTVRQMDEPDEKPALAGDSEKPDSEVMVLAQKPAEPSEPESVVPEDESGLSIQEVLAESGKARLVDVPAMSDPAPTLPPEATAQPADPQGSPLPQSPLEVMAPRK